MKDIYRVLDRPHLTEKAIQLKDDARYLAFRVHPDANKPEIKEAVERIFNVKVAEVRVLRMPPKKRRMGRFAGHRPGYKKALVQLKPGEKMVEYFETL